MNEGNWIKKQLKFLIALQKYYVDFFSVEDYKKQILKLKEEKLKSKINVENALKEKKEILSNLKNSLSSKQIESKDLKSRLKILEDHEKDIKTQKEYNTMNTEKESWDNLLKTLGEDIKFLIRNISDAELEITELEETLTERTKDLDQLTKKANKEIIEIEKKLQNLLLEKEKLLKDIDRRILTRFEFIINSKKDSGIVPVINEVCQGCNIIVSPTLFSKILKCNDFIFCTNCSRIVYFPHYVTV